MQLDLEEVMDLLYGYEFEVYTREYGTVEVISTEDLIDDIIPQIIEMINNKSDNKVELI